MTGEDANTRIEKRMPQLRLPRIVEALFFSFALISMIYATTTSLRNGYDLAVLQNAGRAWTSGIYEVESLLQGYPPFLVVLLAPLAVLSFDKLRVLWLALNLISTGLSILLAVKLWGADWSLRTRSYLAAFLLSIAPWRVTLRNGQISLMITVLILGALLLRKQGKKAAAGMLVGLSLCKYSLSLPFFLYLVWRREWKVAGIAVLLPALLTVIFGLRLGLSPVRVNSDYVGPISKASLSNSIYFTGTTEVKPLLLTLTGGNNGLSAILTVALWAAALLCMGIIFTRTRHCESIHVGALALFSLWSVYHRTYDSVLCILPAAIMLGLIIQRKHVAFAAGCIAALSLFALSVPGLLSARPDLMERASSGHPIVLLGLHIERVIVFAMFWSLIILLYRAAWLSGHTVTSMGQRRLGAPAESSFGDERS